MIRRLTPLLFLCALVAGCGGGSSSLPQARVNGGPPGPQSVTVSITIPSAPAGAAAIRRPRYISTNTNSASISVNGGAPVVVNLAPGSPNCSSGQPRTCTVSVSAPVGADTFAEKMYQSSDGTGLPLSQTTTSFTVVAGKANTVTMTLDGVVAFIVLNLANPNPPVGSPTSIPMTATLKDASLATIVGNEPFANPITLTDSDTSGATALSKTTLNSPGDAASLNVTYTGAPIAQAVFSATASGVASGNITPATLIPSTPAGFVDWTTYAFDSQRSGFNPSSTAFTPASISGLKLAWQINSTGDSQTQPIVATNIAGHAAIVIIGNFNGVKAYDAVTGATVWQTTLGTQNLQSCSPQAPVAGTAFYDRALGSIFIAGGNSGNPSHVIMYRLDVTTGKVTGSVDVTPVLLNGEAVFAHNAVTFANGQLYIGTGSNCEGQVGGLLSWRGRVVSVDPSAMQVTGTFFSTYGVNGQNNGGGGVWAWGGVAADLSGNIYAATGNAETASSVSATPAPPFVLAPSEQAGYGEHLVKLTSNLSTVQDSNYPGFNFQIGGEDLDYTGSPVIYQPPLVQGCGNAVLSATQGKGGTVVINNTQQLTPALNQFKLSVPSGRADYMGNPAYSPLTGLLYAAIASSGNGSSLLPPGLAAIGSCGSAIAWNVQFGPDSQAYGGGPHPRSAPTVTAGGVVFMGTPCTNDGNGGCGAAGTSNGAVWAIDASVPRVLPGGKPVLLTTDRVLMAPTVVGQWMYVLDDGGNLYALTIDPNVVKIQAKPGRRAARSFVIRSQ